MAECRGLGKVHFITCTRRPGSLLTRYLGVVYPSMLAIRSVRITVNRLWWSYGTWVLRRHHHDSLSLGGMGYLAGQAG